MAGHGQPNTSQSLTYDIPLRIPFSLFIFEWLWRQLWRDTKQMQWEKAHLCLWVHLVLARCLRMLLISQRMARDGARDVSHWGNWSPGEKARWRAGTVRAIWEFTLLNDSKYSWYQYFEHFWLENIVVIPIIFYFFCRLLLMVIVCY